MKQELKASQEELAKQNQLPNVTMSFEEIGNSALKALKNAKMYTTLTYQIGQPVLLTINDVNVMGGLENEYGKCYNIQRNLMSIFRDIGLTL